MGTSVFISDLHLSHDSAHIQHFLRFCKELPKDTRALYILGDLFELWVGDDDLDAFSRLIIDSIHHLAEQGIKVYFQHGNRDFLISKRFAKLSNAILLPEEYVLTLPAMRILLMHGDTLCEQDIAYQKARKWMHHAALQWIFLKLPLNWRRQFAYRLRQKSARYTSTQAPEIMDVTQTAVERVMKQHQADILIHGHTHQPGIHSFKLGDKAVKRAVLPAWHSHADALLLQEDGQISWVPIF